MIYLRERCAEMNKLYKKEPQHAVVETNDGLLIDDFKLKYVVEDSINAKQLTSEDVEVTVTFVAKSYEKRLPE
nr:MAG TPA: hypothetical protein [Caudoviricetes sp.]